MMVVVVATIHVMKTTESKKAWWWIGKILILGVEEEEVVLVVVDAQTPTLLCQEPQVGATKTENGSTQLEPLVVAILHWYLVEAVVYSLMLDKQGKLPQ